MAKKRKKSSEKIAREIERVKLVHDVYVVGTAVAIGIVIGTAIIDYFAISLKRINKINNLEKQLQQANNREKRILKSKIIYLKRKIRKSTIKIK